MTETIEPVPDRIDQQQLAQQLIDTAREQGVELVGPCSPSRGSRDAAPGGLRDLPQGCRLGITTQGGVLS